MKTTMKIITIAAYATVAIMTTECNSKKEKEPQNNSEVSNEKTSDSKIETVSLTNVSDSTKNQVNTLIDSYLDLKNALVNSKSQDAKNAASKLMFTIDSFNSKTFPVEQKGIYDPQIKLLKDNATAIAKANNIADQRKSFASITKPIYVLAKSFHPKNEDLYYQYCPMAFDGNGGFWVSEKEEIKNPYFGEEMLSCGENKEKIGK